MGLESRNEADASPRGTKELETPPWVFLSGPGLPLARDAMQPDSRRGAQPLHFLVSIPGLDRSATAALLQGEILLSLGEGSQGVTPPRRIKRAKENSCSACGQAQFFVNPSAVGVDGDRDGCQAGCDCGIFLLPTFEFDPEIEGLGHGEPRTKEPWKRGLAADCAGPACVPAQRRF